MAHSPRGGTESKVVGEKTSSPRSTTRSSGGGVPPLKVPALTPLNIDLDALHAAEANERHLQRVHSVSAWLVTTLLVVFSVFVGYNASLGEWLQWNAVLVVIVNIWSNLSSDALRGYYPTLPLRMARWLTLIVFLLATLSGVSVYMAGVQLKRPPKYQESMWIWLAQITTVLCGFIANVAQRELQLALSPLVDIWVRRFIVALPISRPARPSHL